MAIIVFLFLIIRIIPELFINNAIETSLLLSIISLFGNLGVAWLVQRFGRFSDSLKKVSILLISIFIFSAFSAVIGAGWFAMQHDLPMFKTIWMWWGANVSGTVVAATVLTGFTRDRTYMSVRNYIYAIFAVIIIGFSAGFIFNMPLTEAENAGLIYGLACITVLLTVLVPLIGGNQAGALAFFTLCSVVIFYSWQQTGPFFIRGLFNREPLLLAQFYLSGTAILMIFLRLQVRIYDSRPAVSKDSSREIAFRLNPISGHIDWEPDVKAPWNDIFSKLIAEIIFLY